MAASIPNASSWDARPSAAMYEPAIVASSIVRRSSSSSSRRGASYSLRVAELEAIGITTADLGASLRFYGLLGLTVPGPDDDHVEAQVPGGLRLMWDTEELIRQIEPNLPSPVVSGLCSPSAVNAGFEGKAEPWDAFWGQRFAYLRDPDGNTVALFAPLG
jgi:catechol 2,3-dioxygenase-like lactoylglutathione lyase family enzyme